MDDGASARMMLEVLDAGNWTEFRRALEHYYSPGAHLVYADVDGNVGYHTMVHRPLTARSPRRSLEGWTGREEVLGRVPFDELPHLLNPESGYVSHANNLPVGSWYPYDLGLATGGTGHTSRSLRLQELLKGDRKFSVDDFERVIHRDDVNSIVATLLPIARKVVEEDSGVGHWMAAKQQTTKGSQNENVHYWPAERQENAVGHSGGGHCPGRAAWYCRFNRQPAHGAAGHQPHHQPHGCRCRHRGHRPLAGLGVGHKPSPSVVSGRSAPRGEDRHDSHAVRCSDHQQWPVHRGRHQLRRLGDQ
jgi:hypothetical protein